MAPAPRERPYEYDDPTRDTDEDGIADPDDLCPTDWGLPNRVNQKHGCPTLVELMDSKKRYRYDDPARDSDRDGVVDPTDACPTEPAQPGAHGGAPGCPKTINRPD